MTKRRVFEYLFLAVSTLIASFVSWSFYFDFAIIVRPEIGRTREESFRLRNQYCVDHGLDNLLVSFIMAALLSILFYVLFKKMKVTLLLFVWLFAIATVGNYFGIANYFYGMVPEINYHFPPK